jgi:hypothetical protein
VGVGVQVDEVVGLMVEVEVDVNFCVDVFEAVEVVVIVVVDVGVKEFGLGATSRATIPKQ